MFEFQLTGRRPKWNFISHGSVLRIHMFLLPYLSELEISYQVTDNSTVAKQSLPDISAILKPFSPFLIWKSAFVVKTCRILAPVYRRLSLYTPKPRQFYLYIGPGILSPRILWESNWFHAPTFQLFLILVTPIDNTKNEPRLDFGARHVTLNKIHITNYSSITLPPCSNHLVSNLKHCIFNITSDQGYVNLSISKLSYMGSDFSYTVPVRDPDLRACVQGGVAFSLESTTEDFRMKHLCNNYSSNPSDTERNNNYDKPMMNVVSGTRQGMVLVVYAFQSYSDVKMKATISATPCKGLRKYKLFDGNQCC